MFLGPQVFLHFGISLVLLQLASGIKLVARALVGLVGLHRCTQGVLLAGEFGQPSVVRGNLRPTHLRFDLPIATRDAIQPINQAKFSAWCGFAAPPHPNNAGNTDPRDWGVPHKGGLPPL